MPEPAMRILMLVFNQVGKGTYWRAFHLGRHLARQGHQVTLVAMRKQWATRPLVRTVEGLVVVEAPDILWGPLRSGWDPYEALWRTLWLRERDFDLVHAFEARPTVLLPALYKKQRHDIPLIMDWCDWFGRGGSVEERTNPLMRALLRPVETFFEERFRTRADGTTVICTTLLHKAVDLGVPDDSILLLRNGADLEGIRPQERRASRERVGLNEGLHYIGYMGAISPRDAALMASAFDRIHQAEPLARLLLIGYVNAPVEEMVRVPRSVVRTGVLPYHELSDYLGACDFCWLPNRDSGANRGRWPLKFTDYMAAGRAIVATAVGDIEEEMQRYPIGLLARDEAGDLAEKSLALLATPARAEEMGRAARQVAERHFDWQHLTAEMEAFYWSVLQNR